MRGGLPGAECRSGCWAVHASAQGAGGPAVACGTWACGTAWKERLRRARLSEGGIGLECGVTAAPAPLCVFTVTRSSVTRVIQLVSDYVRLEV